MLFVRYRIVKKLQRAYKNKITFALHRKVNKKMKINSWIKNAKKD